MGMEWKGREIYMKKALEVSISGIKCDKQSCGFRDDSVKVEDYDKWLNKTCPKCNSNLLSETKYSNAQLLIKANRIINNMRPEQLRDFVGNFENSEKEQVSVELNSTDDTELADNSFQKYLRSLLKDREREEKLYEVKYNLNGTDITRVVPVIAESRELAILMVENPQRTIINVTTAD